MAASDSETSTASATSQELQLFPEEGVASSAVQSGATEVPAEPEAQMVQAAELPELPELPQELKNVARALEKVMGDPGQLPGAFSNFCAAAYVKPEWAGAASDYLAVLFDEQQDLLADMTRVPDLIIELGSGHYTLTFLVASRWAAKADLARLTRLAEALIVTQAKMKSPEVVDLMLALITSLAISRYSRAEQLLAVAEGHVTVEQQDVLQEARLWLDAGSIVRSCTQDARELWDQRLRRPRAAWTWSTAAECAALAQLAECLDTEFTAARLFKAVVPAPWWDLLVARSAERRQYEAALTAAKTAARQQQARGESTSGEVTHEPPRQVVRQPIIIWRGIPFFVGGLVGACALLLGIWVSSYDLLRPGTDGVGMVPPAASPAGSDGPPAAVAAAPVHPNEHWRREQAASLAAEVPELRPWVEKIGMGDWQEYENVLKGLSADLPAEDAKYQKLLLWLHLDPPANAEIRQQVPLLLAQLRQDSTVIGLWEKLVYPGSLNAKEIQAAALRTQHDQTESWSPTQRALLSKLAAVDIQVPGAKGDSESED